MKIRDSGMPEETMWSEFFNPQQILNQMGFSTDLESVVDFGCGFGTFSIPAAQSIQGKVHAFDIDPDMITILQNKIKQQCIQNIELHLIDFITEGSKLPPNSVDYVMLFNILHHDNPSLILHEIYRIIKPGKKVGIIHWRSDISTPRGPELSIRPLPKQCKKWAIESGFSIEKELILEPYHFGLIIYKL